MTQTVPLFPAGVSAARADEYRREGWWPDEPLAERFLRWVTADPARQAVVDDRGVGLSRAELWDRAGALGELMSGAGVRSGDPVLIYLPNSAYWQVVFLACLRQRAVPATLPIATDAATLAGVVERIGARAVVAPDRHRGHPTGEWARAAATGAGASVLVLDGNGAGDGARWTHGAGTGAVSAVPDGVDHLMFTSSTTGPPKAVMHTADTLAAGNVAFSRRFDLDEHTPIYMPSPLGHSVGAWHGARLSLFLGALLVVQDAWDPVRGLDLVDEHACAFTAAATPFLTDLVDATRPDGSAPKLASLRTFLCGGAPVPPVLLERAHEQAPHTFVTVLWGMTEGTGTTCTPRSSREQLTGTAGAPVPDLELTILDPDPHGVGELAMRGPQVFVGYLGQQQLYRDLLTDDGFFRTGDLATIGDDGYLRLAGRLKDMIIRGGVNIAPDPIEDAIARHPAVRRVAVIGAADERLGERICAVIVTKDTPPTLDELNAWLTEDGVPRRKLPESLHVVDNMPVTAAGKIRKVDLRRALEERR